MSQNSKIVSVFVALVVLLTACSKDPELTATDPELCTTGGTIGSQKSDTVTSDGIGNAGDGLTHSAALPDSDDPIPDDQGSNDNESISDDDDDESDDDASGKKPPVNK